jgi:hypothetical protein
MTSSWTPREKGIWLRNSNVNSHIAYNDFPGKFPGVENPAIISPLAGFTV